MKLTKCNELHILNDYSRLFGRDDALKAQFRKIERNETALSHDVRVHCKCNLLHFVKNRFVFCAMPRLWGGEYGQESFIPRIRNSILDLA